MSRRGLGLVAALVAAACTKEGPPAEDRLITKLKAERDRQAHQGAPAAANPVPAAEPALVPEEHPLAQAATEPGAPRPLRLPAQVSFAGGGVAFTLTGLETSRAVSSGKLKLSTDETFLRVELSAVVAKPAQLDLSRASLRQGEQTFTIARDVQRLGGSRELSQVLSPEIPAELVLMFELPPEAVAPGLTLVLAGADGKALAEAPLQ